MLGNISFYIKLLLVTLLFLGSTKAIDLSIIPLKKPILDKITIQKKLTQGIIRPKSKPIKKDEIKKLAEEVLKPESKPLEKSKKKITKTIEKKVVFLVPKSKPLTVKKASSIKKTVQNFILKKILILPKNLFKQ